VQSFADDRKKLGDGMANLEQQFTQLATLRRDVEALSTTFDRSLDRLAISDESAGDTEARVAEIADFIEATQAQCEEIERTMTRFGELRAQLGALQSRLAPLEAKDGGVADVTAQVQDIRDRLVAKIAHIEADENGDLASRVKAMADAKQELEKRVSSVTEHFSKLASIRNDIAGLFDKLSNAADSKSS
jgi:chromosome segregation ATPase